MTKYCNRLVKGGFIKFVFTLSILLGFTNVYAQDVKGDDERPRDVQVVKEYTDAKGNKVKVVKYKKGAMVITEEIYTSKYINFSSSSFPKINPDTLDRDSLMIVVDKSKHFVQLLYKKKTIRRYKAVFGPKPLQNKCMEGDRCTPEGWFTIKQKNPASKYDKFMLLDYPTDSSKVRFQELKSQGKIPASALIGGDIGIHGIWEGGDQMIDMGVGWTDGCVALKNKDIEELFTFVGVGTRVLIRK